MIGAVLLASATAALAPLQPGTWSNIRIDRDSGDYAGLEIRIDRRTADHAIVVMCGDGCGGPEDVPLVREAQGFRFRTPPRSLGDTSDVVSCDGRFGGRALRVACVGLPLQTLRFRPRPSLLATRAGETPVLVK